MPEKKDAPEVKNPYDQEPESLSEILFWNED